MLLYPAPPALDSRMAHPVVAAAPQAPWWLHDGCAAQNSTLHHAAGRLPSHQFESDWLRSCTTRRVGSSLLAAGNLAPAATASSTLTASLHALSPSNNRVHHSHGWRIGHSLCADQQKKGREVPHTCGTGVCCTSCNVTPSSRPWPPSEVASYVMTLRDPAARFESAVLTVLRNVRKDAKAVAGCKICPDVHFPWKHAHAYVNDFRNASAPGHRAAVTQYLKAVANPRFSHRIGTIFHGGNNMLTAQADYLRGVDCAEVELHFVCQETLEADWATLLTKFGLADQRRRDASQHLLVSQQKRSSDAHPDDIARSRLSAEDRDFVRRCMYPWDDALHSLACPHARTLR